MTFKTLAAAWTAVACLALPTAALAAPVNYVFNGTFNEQQSTGTYSGSFTYETTTQKVTAASVTVSAGLSDDGSPRSAATYNTVTASSQLHFTVTNAPLAQGNRVFVILATGAFFSSPNPAISNAYDGQCTDASCPGLNAASAGTSTGSPPITLAQGVPPTPVPTLTEWAMILLGLTLAGGAVVVIQRRRMAA